MAAIGDQKAPGRVPADSADNGGHDGGDGDGDRISGQWELAPKGIGWKTIWWSLATIPAMVAAGTGDN